MCGVAGAFNIPNASYLVSLMLKRLQHRGQETAGIVSFDSDAVHLRRKFGLVGEVFRHTDFPKELPGHTAIGHVRYSTQGDSANESNIQPFTVQNRYGYLQG